ncbi:hypothetical protein K1719_043628 [Acacia pycnantha]|nr:hypothetical protein K1719_043628 [Acacia pycnantha]
MKALFKLKRRLADYLLEMTDWIKGKRRECPLALENTQKDFQASNLKIMIKIKDSQAPPTGSVTSLVLSNVQPSPGNFPGSSVHPVTQGDGERPCKNSRSRRVSLVSPAAHNVEAQVSSEGCPAFGFNHKDSSVVNSGYQLETRIDKSTNKYKRPAHNTLRLGLSESEEFGAVENKLMEKGMNNSEFSLSAKKDGHSNLEIRKNRIRTDKFGDCVPRKGRTKPGPPSGRVKSENLPILKPAENMRPADKSKMEYGCPPSKKQKDCKVSTHAGQMHNNGPSDSSGSILHESGNSVDPACSGPFWGKVESSFATISEENVPFLKQQMTLAEELDKTLSQMISVDHIMDDIMNNEATHCSEGRQRSCYGGKGAKTNTLTGKYNGERLDNATPLYKLLCSAIISEDGSEELSPLNEALTICQKCSSDDSPCDSCNQLDFEVESQIILQIQNGPLGKLSCNKSIAFNPFNETCSNDLDQWKPAELSGGGRGFPTDDEYQRMSLDDKVLLELHSIGLYPEILPDLAEEDEAKNQNIVVPEEKLCQQIRRKKNFDTTDRSIEKGRDPEREKIVQVVFDQLIEMAYRKISACLESENSKGDGGIKVSKQVALGFVKRALGSCKIDEETGNSCFSEPDLRHIILSTHSCESFEKSDACINIASGLAIANNKSSDLKEASTAVAVSGAPEKCDSHIDDVGTGVGGSFTKAMNLNGLVNFRVKGKRSRRDRNGSKDEHKTDGDNNDTSKGKQSAESENLQPPESLSGDLDFSQGIDTWLDDVGNLPDNDLVGLSIPMDDLSEIM